MGERIERFFTVPRWLIITICATAIFFILLFWGLSLYTWGIIQALDGYNLGQEKVRTRIRAVTLVESNEMFIYDHGAYFYAKRDGKNRYKKLEDVKILQP